MTGRPPVVVLPALLLLAQCMLVSQDCLNRDLSCGEGVLGILARQANIPASLSVLDLTNGAMASGSTKNVGSVGRGVGGTYKDVTLRLSNSGGQSLSITNVTVTPSSQFTITAAPASIVPGGTSTTMTIRYIPSAAASDTAQFSMTTNDSQNAVFSLTLDGTGVSVGAGLFVYFPFDGNINDLSGNGFNAGYVGPAAGFTTGRHGTAGTAALLDGSGNYIQSNPGSPWAWNSTFSISAWVLTNQTDFSIMRRNHNGFNTTSFDFGIKPGTMQVWRDAQSVVWMNITAPVSYQSGQWQHLAFVSSAANVTFYFNGVNVGTGVITGSPGFGSPVIDFGAVWQFNLLNGALDDVRVYNGVAITAAQVQALYNQD